MIFITKRKDSKGRNLRNGENQRPDGRYEYRYMAGDKRRSVYSWRLVDTDAQPANTRPSKSLRALEAEIEEKNGWYLSHVPGNLKTVKDLVEKYTPIAALALSPSTLYQYTSVYNKNLAPAISDMPISELSAHALERIVLTEIREGRTTAQKMIGAMPFIQDIFKEAQRDGVIPTNFADGLSGRIRTISRVKRKRRHGLTPVETSIFVDELSRMRDRDWYIPIVMFILGSGCRIGEAIALQRSDRNYGRRAVEISKTISRCKDGDTYKYMITPPKTASSIRTIPMSSMAYDALRAADEVRPSVAGSIDGYSDFVFTTRKGEAHTEYGVLQKMRQVVQQYNERETIVAKNSGREPVLLPNITPHTLRHTFCDYLYKSVRDVAVVKEIMGHSSVDVTLDIYHDVSFDDKVNGVMAAEQSAGEYFGSYGRSKLQCENINNLS